MSALDLPQNVEAEAALLGALMCENKLVDGIADRLAAEHFFEPLHGRIYSAILGQCSLGRIANPVTLKPFLEGDAALNEVGGPGYLAILTGSGAGIIGAKDFADQILELAHRRALIGGCREAIALASGYDSSLDDAAEAVEAAVALARDAGDDCGEYSGAEALKLVVDGFDQAVRGVLCGIIPSVDRLLGPMRPTQMVVGAGRPGMGKTATAISYALGAADRGHGVLFISLEMGAEQLAERMAADLCFEDHRIPYEAIRDRTLSTEQKREVVRAMNRLETMPLQILDKQGLTISRLRTLVRRWKRRFAARGQKLELVVVDYLQLLRGDRGMDRFETVTEISKSLKEIAKAEGLAVFALAQLSREVEKRVDKRPQLSDLRESGQIEQDADAVLFFLRHEYYLRQLEEPDEALLQKVRGRIEFICAKRRNGQSGSAPGDFLATYQAVRG